MKKKLKVEELRGLEQQVAKGEISYSRMIELINEKFNEVYEFKIFSNITTTFSYMDRIRILFGKKVHSDSVIIASREVEILKPTLTTTYVEKIFPRKTKNIQLQCN